MQVIDFEQLGLVIVESRRRDRNTRLALSLAFCWQLSLWPEAQRSGSVCTQHSRDTDRGDASRLLAWPARILG